MKYLHGSTCYWGSVFCHYAPISYLCHRYFSILSLRVIFLSITPPLKLYEFSLPGSSYLILLLYGVGEGVLVGGLFPICFCGYHFVEVLPLIVIAEYCHFPWSVFKIRWSDFWARFKGWKYPCFAIAVWRARESMSRGRHHLLPMIFANYLTVLGLIPLFWSFVFKSWLASPNECWACLIALDECTLNKCSFLNL